MPKHLLSTTAGSDQTNPALLRQHPPHFISASSFFFLPPPPSLISAIEYAEGTSDISLICRQADIYAVLKLIWHHCFGCWVKVAGGIKGLRPPKTDGGVSAMPPSERKKEKKCFHPSGRGKTQKCAGARRPTTAAARNLLATHGCQGKARWRGAEAPYGTEAQMV